jgi:hypothetical protein
MASQMPGAAAAAADALHLSVRELLRAEAAAPALIADGLAGTPSSTPSAAATAVSSHAAIPSPHFGSGPIKGAPGVTALTLEDLAGVTVDGDENLTTATTASDGAPAGTTTTNSTTGGGESKDESNQLLPSIRKRHAVDQSQRRYQRENWRLLRSEGRELRAAIETQTRTVNDNTVNDNNNPATALLLWQQQLSRFFPVQRRSRRCR